MREKDFIVGASNLSIQTWGNSLAVRIPAKLPRAALDDDQLGYHARIDGDSAAHTGRVGSMRR